MKNLILFICSLLLALSKGAPNDFVKRIVHGNEVKLGEIPFQVSLQLPGSEHFCGGSIVNKYYVVTAAHCLENMNNPSRVTIVAGTVNYKIPVQVHQAEKLIQHEKFTYSGTTEFDIALVKSKTPFDFTEHVKPARLPEPHEKFATNSTAVVSGWGQTGFGRTETSPKLMKAHIRVADQDYCVRIMEEANDNGKRVHPSNICAYEPSYRKGHCSYDSGGPLTVDGKLAGIVSWSVKDPYCASVKYPGVYTRVSEYIDWINKTAV